MDFWKNLDGIDSFFVNQLENNDTLGNKGSVVYC